MRTIKFRAWDSEYKKMMTDNFLIRPWDGIAINDCNLMPKLILMQFTGLTDRHGKEIYEGDIVQIYKHMSNEKHEVKKIVAWDNERCEYSGIYPNIAAWSKHEVIGNIYENPELLEK